MREIDKELIKASEYNYLEKVKQLLEEGADVNAKDDFGKTALMWACEYGYKEIAELLIEKGADLNAQDKYGLTALIYATKWSQKEVVKLLLEKGADMNIKDKDGRTALWYAFLIEDEEIIELLKSYETKTKKMICPNCKAETDGLIETPYGKFCSNCKDDIPDEKDIRGNYNDGDEYFWENIDF
jgi:ankyrin repeat protein